MSLDRALLFVDHNAVITIVPAALSQREVVEATLAPSISLGNARARRGAARVTGWDGSVSWTVCRLVERTWLRRVQYHVDIVEFVPVMASTAIIQVTNIQDIARQSLLTTLHYNSYTAHREELRCLLAADRLSY